MRKKALILSLVLFLSILATSVSEAPQAHAAPTANTFIPPLPSAWPRSPAPYNQYWGKTETSVIVDPLNPNHIVTGMQNANVAHYGNSTFTIASAVSQDGGNTWKAGGYNPNTFGGLSSTPILDPSLVFNPAFSNKIFMAQSYNLTFPFGIHLFTSLDGGYTFTQFTKDAFINGTTLSGDDGSSWKPCETSNNYLNVALDYDQLYADTNPSSPNYGRMYIMTDLLVGNTTNWFGNIKYTCANNGGLNGRRFLVFESSSDGGTTWANPKIFLQLGYWSNQVSKPELAIDSSGDVFVVGRSYGIVVGGQPLCTSIGNEIGVVVARSTNGGSTFTESCITNNLYFVGLSAGPGTIAAGGNNVYVAYYGFNSSGTNHATGLYLFYSMDKGITWKGITTPGSGAGIFLATATLFSGPNAFPLEMTTDSNGYQADLMWRSQASSSPYATIMLSQFSLTTGVSPPVPLSPPGYYDCCTNGNDFDGIAMMQTSQLSFNAIAIWAMWPSSTTCPPDVVCNAMSQELSMYVSIVSNLMPLGLEAQKVLFRDDFLYNNPLLETSWIIDAYQTPKVNVGVYTSSGYLVMKATGTGLETVHVANATYTPAGYTNGTIVKRKMTVAALPFTKTETPETASLKVGMAPLWPSGAYPGTSPYGTPMTDFLGLCNSGPTGLDYLRFSSNGTVTYATCGSGGSNNNKLATGLNPSLYTVFTIVTSGIFCSRCSDNVLLNSSWVYFRVYQENTAGLIISSTDKNLNFTSKVAPLNQTSYAFISQENSNGGATGQLSKIDFVQVQNYGSPVCQIGLVAPSGTLCTRLPVNPGRLTSDLVGSIAWIATLLGGGDEQAGVIMLFVILSGGMAGVPLFFTRSLEVGILGELSVLGFFVYAGFLPLWLLVLVFVGGAVMVVLLFQRLVGQHGGGASDG